MTFMDAASEKTLRSTVALTAARGRGKVMHVASCHLESKQDNPAGKFVKLLMCTERCGISNFNFV